MEIKYVLDHGFVRLVASMGDDLSVVRAARISHNATWRAGTDQGSDQRLIDYLWKNQHTSPFESVEFQFEVYAPIFVARQWMRHRTWSYNEVSGRYTELPKCYYIPELENIGTQHKNNKQAREFNPLDETAKNFRKHEIRSLKSRCADAFKCYHELLNSGWPRELARMVLPINTYTHFFAKVDLHNLFRFINLRNHEHSQYEIQVYAEAIEELIEPIVPVCMQTFKKYKFKLMENVDVN